MQEIFWFNNFCIICSLSIMKNLSSDIWQMWKRTTSAARDKFADVHTRLMKKHYEAVPQWWFHILSMPVRVLINSYNSHGGEFYWLVLLLYSLPYLLV